MDKPVIQSYFWTNILILLIYRFFDSSFSILCMFFFDHLLILYMWILFLFQWWCFFCIHFFICFLIVFFTNASNDSNDSNVFIWFYYYLYIEYEVWMVCISCVCFSLCAHCVSTLYKIKNICVDIIYLCIDWRLKSEDRYLWSTRQFWTRDIFQKNREFFLTIFLTGQRR